MEDSNELIEKSTNLIRLDEGLKLTVYFCSRGFESIGYGRNLKTKGISKPEAEILLSNDINDAITDLIKNIPWFRFLSINRQVVLIDIYVNAGMKGELSFKKFLEYLQKSMYKEAANELRNSLAYQKLTNRYERLARMVENDTYELN